LKRNRSIRQELNRALPNRGVQLKPEEVQRIREGKETGSSRVHHVHVIPYSVKDSSRRKDGQISQYGGWRVHGTTDPGFQRKGEKKREGRALLSPSGAKRQVSRGGPAKKKKEVP